MCWCAMLPLMRKLLIVMLVTVVTVRLVLVVWISVCCLVSSRAIRFM